MLCMARVEGKMQRSFNDVQKLPIIHVHGQGGLSHLNLVPVHHLKVELGFGVELRWAELSWMSNMLIPLSGSPSKGFPSVNKH